MLAKEVGRLNQTFKDRSVFPSKANTLAWDYAGPEVVAGICFCALCWKVCAMQCSSSDVRCRAAGNADVQHFADSGELNKLVGRTLDGISAPYLQPFQIKNWRDTALRVPGLGLPGLAAGGGGNSKEHNILQNEIWAGGAPLYNTYEGIAKKLLRRQKPRSVGNVPFLTTLHSVEWRGVCAGVTHNRTLLAYKTYTPNVFVHHTPRLLLGKFLHVLRPTRLDKDGSGNGGAGGVGKGASDTAVAVRDAVRDETAAIREEQATRMEMRAVSQ
eukprot:415556-Pelagomonas_calceolata.AAC.1